jgi:alanine racemase
MSSHGHRLSAIARALGTTVQGDGYDPLIEHLLIDSRKPLPEHGALFLALKGARHDGHRYLPELVERGLQCAVVSEPAPGVPLALHVPDTLDALQRIAAWHRAHFALPVVGITGSNGKTVVKEWLFHLLRGHEHIVRSPGSWNSQVGVPLSVWDLRAEHTLGIFEAGISQPGEMDRLRAVIKPTIGLFTNIGPAHGENFPGELEKALEKMRLFADAEVLVYCADQPVIAQALERSQLSQRLALRGWSREQSAWLHVLREEPVAFGTRITCMQGDVPLVFDIPFTDHASIENALHCATLLLHLGQAPATIAERMPHLPPVAMRLEVLEGVHGSTLINDAYSNDVASLTVALEHLSQVGRGRPRSVVLTDIAGSGEAPETLYRRVAALLRQAGTDTLLAVGPELQAHAALFSGQVHTFASAGELLQRFDPASLGGHTVLVKGARSFALERVVQRWQRQVHGTVLEIDMEAIRHNLNHFRGMLGPSNDDQRAVNAPIKPDGTRSVARGLGPHGSTYGVPSSPVKLMAMVKAFGYGSGALELARLFAHEQVHYLGVAYADEGIELRQQGIQLPILVMNPEPVPFEVLDRYRLEAEVYDERSLRAAADHARLHPGAPPVHLKLDTGMHRLGFMPSELPQLLQLLGQSPHLRIASTLSHLAASEDPAHDAFTLQQIAAFGAMAQAIDAQLGYRPFRHLANTAAIRRFPQARFDLVRLGIGLHGIGADAAETALLRPTVSLRTPIAQLRQVPVGDSVSYGRRWVAQRPSTIATLPIGYADGLSRRLGNGVGRLWIHGLPAPIVGSVCMDMCMVDVTDIPCHLGDLAYLFNARHPVSEVARDLGTIPYEVLTGIAHRVKRVHVQG